VKCSDCKQRDAVSVAIGKCEVCLYRVEVSTEAALRQVEAAERARARRKRPKAS
jgi:hypothetical protein